MRIDDFILFGKTVPEESKKYGKTVCCAGYSNEMRSFLRIYPIGIQYKIGARDMMSIEVDRSKHDSRHESWALKTRDEKSIIGMMGKRTPEEIKSILDKRVSTIDQLNQERASLGVIKPESFDVVMKTRESIQDPNQLSIFDDFKDTSGFKTSGQYFKVPYLTLSTGKQKYIQLREWGLYELMRKNPEKITAEYIMNALHIEKTKDVYCVVGNMNQFRNRWLIIKTFSFDKRLRQVPML